MNRLLFLFLLLHSTSTFCQHFGKIYIDCTQAYTENNFDNQIKKGQENKNITSTSKNKINDTLIYVVKNEVECFTNKMTFNYSTAAVGKMICVFQSYIFDCEPCAKNHLADIIRTYGFRKITEDSYLSMPVYKIEMKVEQEINRLVLVFRKTQRDRKSYKVLYKSLKNKTTQ